MINAVVINCAVINGYSALPAGAAAMPLRAGGINAGGINADVINGNGVVTVGAAAVPLSADVDLLFDVQTATVIEQSVALGYALMASLSNSVDFGYAVMRGLSKSIDLPYGYYVALSAHMDWPYSIAYAVQAQCDIAYDLDGVTKLAAHVDLHYVLQVEQVAQILTGAFTLRTTNG